MLVLPRYTYFLSIASDIFASDIHYQNKMIRIYVDFICC